MKTKQLHRHLLIMAMSTLLALSGKAGNESTRMVVISDTHLLSPQLVTPGRAIDRADADEMKMMALSDEIMAALIDSIIDINPSLVLVTGDLTHNGERLSHERMAGHLSRLAGRGILSLVIPGNHDCNNPYSMRFDGDETAPTPTVNREEFAHIYRDYGYGAASVRDTASLSYCCEPVKGLVVIGIDSNMDELNRCGDSVTTYHNAGRIKPQTLQWVVEQATQAHDRGKKVIAMVHHHVLQHFDSQDKLLANYIVHDHDTVATHLMDAGIHVIFTGHLHVTDAVTARNATLTGSIVEVATGSAICYPFPMRVVTIPANLKTLEVNTAWMRSTASCPTLREMGRQRVINAAPALAAMLSARAWDKLGGRLPQLKALLEMGGNTVMLPQTPRQAAQLTLRHLGETLSRTLLAVVEGNENERDGQDIIEQGKLGLRAMLNEVAPGQADSLWDFFVNEVEPRIEPPARSILEDRNAVGTSHESITNDLTLTVTL